MQTLDTYLSRITSQHRGKPKFEASVSASLTPLLDLLNGLELLPSQFDLDNAVGPQLDATGAWIGRSRWIPQPLPDVWFSFDTSNKGWNDGFIKGPFNVATMLDRLDDDTYRRLLRAKIMSNNWDGTISNAQAMLDEFFTTAANPGTFILVDEEAQANPVLAAADMRVTVALAGKIPPIVDLEIFAQNLIPLAMGGVDQEVRVVSVDNSPMFGFDLNNQYVGGFGSGAFGVDPTYLVATAPRTNAFSVNIRHSLASSGAVTTWAGPSWSPTDHSEFITISGTHNEIATRNNILGGSSLNCRSDIGQTTGTRYFEVAITSFNGGSAVGIGTQQASLTGPIGIDNYSYGYNSSNNAYYQGGFAPTTGSLPAFGQGDVIGIEVNLDANTIRARLNGGAFTPTDSIAAIRPGGEPVFIMATCVGTSAPFNSVSLVNV